MQFLYQAGAVTVQQKLHFYTMQCNADADAVFV